MGTNSFTVTDRAAAFGEEFARRKLPYDQFHCVLSHLGAEQLSDAIAAAEKRERASTIHIKCHRDGQRIERFRWYDECKFALLPIEESNHLEISKDVGRITIKLSRDHLQGLKTLCTALIQGEDDIAFKLTDTVRIWAWGSGLGP